MLSLGSKFGAARVAGALAAAMLFAAPLAACSNGAPASPASPASSGTESSQAAEAGSASVAGKVSLTEEELDNRVASYTSKGNTVEISAREIIEATSTLEQYRRDDNSFNVPSAEDIIGYVRQKLLLEEANAKGMSATDEEITTFAMDNFGSSDYAVIGASYGLDAATVEKLVKDSAVVAKLRESILGDTATLSAPEMPSEPAEGAESTPTADYASYIIALAGDEWDAAAGSWKSPDGPYATALATYEITADSATYEAATAAYYVAVNQYSTAMGEASTAWSEYVNTLFSGVSLTLEGLNAG